MIDNANLNPQEYSKPEKVSLVYLFGNFLKIGSTAFGGFMALVSVIENIIVERRKLLNHEDMLDGISLASVLPGPVAANVVAYVGYRLRGGLGALAATTAVLLPSFLLVVGLTIVYLQAGDIPAVNRILAGFIPAVVAIIISAAYRMSKKAVKGWREVAIAGVSAILLQTIGGIYITFIVIGGSGIIGWLLYRRRVAKELAKQDIAEKGPLALKPIIIPLIILAVFLSFSFLPLPVGQDSLAKLFTTFSGMSLMLFGGGYVIIPMIQEIVVNNFGWLNQQEFASAISMGQITPGPILISAAFIGYKVQGIWGAIVSTVGIFFPPALLMVTMSHLLEHIKGSVIIQAALKGIRPAVIGMIVIAGFIVAKDAPMDLLQEQIVSLGIFVVSLAAIWKFNIEVVFIIPVAGVIGLLLY
ncbi:chromate transporter, chromate ion transporter family [Xenococcus sp. PCC 7305]|uniref:chromate efflux transporter n=1 Tax=Xenococcus sp. PCC 7305 TaxID=102125 RepID=UPI0002ACB8CD|nr:chromate efflux transporter [Xenococcus sp. PCC 7305]ELS01820.1 chromate transporter, chromate ion transporter family [Xenococcus sp. PCC 7305]